MRAKVVEIAAHLMEAAPDDLEIIDGADRGERNTDPSVASPRSRDVADLETARLPEGWRRAREPTRDLQGAAVLVVERVSRVHRRGRPGDRGVSILRYVVSEDCGVMINPMIVEGQVAGGVVQGIGGMLTSTSSTTTTATR